MRSLFRRFIVVLSSCICVIVATALPLSGQTRDKGPWWPHAIWGPDDQAGASNWMTQEKILEAVKLVRKGKVYELGHVYSADMPLLANRSYKMSLVGYPTFGPYEDGLVGQGSKG